MPTSARRGTAPAARPTIDFHAMPGARHFRASDLASWADAQRRYRQLVHERHPDRRPADAGDAAQAEFIEITAAFKRLRERYRADGMLPLAFPPVPVAPPARPARSADDAVVAAAGFTAAATGAPHRARRRRARAASAARARAARAHRGGGLPGARGARLGDRARGDARRTRGAREP